MHKWFNIKTDGIYHTHIENHFLSLITIEHTNMCPNTQYLGDKSPL